MPTFPRDLPPDRVGPLWLPTGLRSRAHAGIIQLRTTQAIGWQWQETWNLLSAQNADHMKVLAALRYGYNRQVLWDVTYPMGPGSGLSRLGAGTPGSITVNGADQTGDTLNTTGWPASTSEVVRAGDLISVDNRVYEVREAANSDVAGAVAVPVTPNVFKSPSNGASVTVSGATFRAMVWSLPKSAQFTGPNYFSGLTVTWVEVVTT